MPQHRRTILILSLALLALTALVYWPGLGGGFLFDDYPNIVTNLKVQPDALTWAALKTAALGYEPGSYGRPLATVTFAFDYLISGKNASSFKVSSLIIHLVNALLVFWLLRRLLALPRAGGEASWALVSAFAIALLWAIHPLQISSVLYVVQRMETLALTFVLLALIAYLRGRTAQRDGLRGWPWLVGSALLAGIGMLSKETAILFPAYALALELTVLRFEAAAPRTRHFLLGAFAMGALIAAIAFFGWILPQYAAPDAFAGRDFNLHERLLTQLRVLPMYLGQMLLPLPATLTFYYDAYPKSTGWLSPASTLAGGMFLLGLAVAAWRLRNRMPLVSLGIAWFFAAHLLTSNVFNLELIFEHRNYFALLGVLLAVADLVRRIPIREGPAMKQAATAVVILAFGFLGLLRAATWGSPLHLFSDLVAKNPNSARASNDLAALYIDLSNSNPDSPFFAMGAKEFERGSRLPNASPLSEQGLILMSATTGQPVRDEWWDRLIHKIRTRPIGPQEMMAVTGLMKQRYRGIELDNKRLSEAYAILLERAPSAQLFAVYGDFALNYLHDPALALRMFNEAVNHDASPAQYASRIASALIEDGHADMAAAILTQSREINTLSVHEPDMGTTAN